MTRRVDLDSGNLRSPCLNCRLKNKSKKTSHLCIRCKRLSKYNIVLEGYDHIATDYGFCNQQEFPTHADVGNLGYQIVQL